MNYYYGINITGISCLKLDLNKIKDWCGIETSFMAFDTFMIFDIEYNESELIKNIMYNCLE